MKMGVINDHGLLFFRERTMETVISFELVSCLLHRGTNESSRQFQGNQDGRRD